MSSILGLPTRGSNVTILITKVHLHPFCVLVEFWGNFSQEKTADYECLAKEIQSPGNTFQEFEGNPGDQCLVQIDGTWYRSRIVTRNGLKYSVFLIDKGITCTTTTSKLAWGKKKHFLLPPEVEFCVLANVLPLSPENIWSPVALEFLKTLSGMSVKAHVQDVLVPHRTFLLNIPFISKQMYEMGIAKKLPPNMFLDFVLMSLQSQSGPEGSSETRYISLGAGDCLHKQELFMYPELPAGTVETVIVTDVTNPQRIFCQLKVFSQELKKLSEQITQCCEGRLTNCIVGPEMIGFPCAARGSDGRWYRSVLQQVFPHNKVVEVLNVDYGTKEFVQVENVRPLAAEFFRMPVVTYICSLHGIIDKGVGWTATQIDYLRTLLLYKTVIAKFEYQSVSEGVYYVTLYGDENTNINNLFGSKDSGSLECEEKFGDYAISRAVHSHQLPALQEQNQRKILTLGQAVEEKEKVKKLPADELSLNSSYVAVVHDVHNPSEFWIQTQNYANEFDELMDSIYHLYKDSENKDVVRNPTLGLYCVAKATDGDFYRATVIEVGETQIKVLFVDYGNTEMVERCNIRTLPDELRKLPCLAVNCSLAGVRPKDGQWNRSACEFFIKVVADKTLNVHVTAKYVDRYVVQLTDPKAQGEKDLATLMCRSGFAERVDTQRQLKAILPPTQLLDARVSGVYRNNGMSAQTPDTVYPASNDRRIPTFKEHMFPIGSVLDVNVSYIESPNDFWCQLLQNAGHLKSLMHDMQAHYAGSKFQPFVETACVVLHPENGLWYRALVIHKHETPHVDVLFVDYGQTETVSLYDLRRICPEFLTLHGQAFRCSLLNPLDPTSATNEWTEEAIARFQSFVETATSNFVILKCTIFAVMYSEQKIVFNIVDLETPFESVSTSMVNLVKSAPLKKSTGPSFRLDTYYYSTHNVKTGTEEQVTVTCVNNVNQFYCQLERNADVIQDLTIKVNNLCHQLENVRLPTVFGTLCFAKYTDGKWYRGQIKATKPVILVHFVDYGDTIEVGKSDLLPVPREANDIMSVPVQAVVCSLSDVPADVPSEVNSWFEMSVTECKFRALVVAREPDGKLLVELYHGNTQLNSKIKRMFHIEMYTEEQVVFQGHRALEASANNAQKTPKAVPKQAAKIGDHTQIVNKNLSVTKPARQTRYGNLNVQSAQKSFFHVRENSHRGKAAPLELYRPPHQRHACERTGNGSEQADTSIKPSVPIEAKQVSPGTEFQKKNDTDKLPKLAQLPSNSIVSGMEADVYVSQFNSLLSFHVQLVREENELLSLVEKLNDPQSSAQTDDIKDLHPGDLVQAEFADDSSRYRAVVKEIHNNTMALVEFVDFGNTAVVPFSKISRLQMHFLQLPMYSIHCMLSNAASLGNEEVLNPEAMSAFREVVGGNGEKVLKCQFIRQSGSVWEVSLEDSGKSIVFKVPTKCSTDGSQITSDNLEQVKEQPAQNFDKMPENSQKLPLNSCPVFYHQEFLEGQTVKVYITTIDDTQAFWCQLADSEELDRIASFVSEVVDAADHKPIDPDTLSPGSPCIALFSDDHLWYRAEVIDKFEDKLSVLFVDYGNKSQVSVTDVGELPTNLMETPPQAFLCELEGFDTSHGSWDHGAVDELSALTTDKELKLTVTRVTREKGKIKCLVQMECEGQVINEALKTWWKSCTKENNPGAVGLTPFYEITSQCDSTVRETALSNGKQEHPESKEMDTAGGCICPLRDYSDEQSIGKLLDLQEEVTSLTSSSKYSKSSDHLHFESFVKSPEEERNQILSQRNSTGPCILTENPRETHSNEGASMNPSMVVSQTEPEGSLPCYSRKDDTMLLPLYTRGDSAILNLMCDKSMVGTDEGTEEDSSSLMDPTQAISESVFATPDLKALPGEVNTCNESSFDVLDYSDPNEQREDEECNICDSRLSSTTVKMVPRRAVCPGKGMDPDVVLPTSVLPAFDAPTEQEIEAADDVQEEKVPYVTTHVKSDLMAEGVTLTDHKDTPAAWPDDTDATAREPQTCAASPQHPSDGCKVTTCFVEGDCLTDVFTGTNEPSDDSGFISGRECLGSRKAEEMDQSESLVPRGELPHERVIDLPSDTEPQADTFPGADMRNLVEDLTCLIGEICLTDVCTDPQQDAETEDGEQLAHTPSEQNEDVSDDLLDEETSSADDSFEAQLSKITHLALVISGGSADTLPVERQPEE